MLKINYYIICFGDAAAYGVYVYVYVVSFAGRSVARPTSLQRIQHIHIHKICCRITETY